MSKELFEKFNEQANYNLGVRGNLSKVMVSGLELAKSMGKENIALKQLFELPPSNTLVHPDQRLDGIKAICETMIQEQEVVEERKMVA